MDTRVKYAKIAKSVLTEFVDFYNQGGGESCGEPLRLVFDDNRQSYLVLSFGWWQKKYTHSATIHLDVRGDKIWIQNDHTEEGIATDLLEAGVPHENIVLGFRHPEIRKYTDFADIAAPDETPLVHTAETTQELVGV